MKRLLILTVAFALLCGGASAEIPAEMKQPIYSECGVVSAYDRYEPDDPDSAISSITRIQSVDTALNLVRITAENDINVFSTGILSEAEWDLDGDGEEEWIVLRQKPEENVYQPYLWLELYGRQDDALVLLQSEKLDRVWHFLCHMDFYLYRLDGIPCLFAYHAESFNASTLHCRIYSLDKGGIQRVASLNIGGDGSTDKFTISADDMQANYSYDWTVDDNPYTAERSAASAAFCERFGLWISSIDPDGASYPDGLDVTPLLSKDYAFAHSAYSVKPKEISLTLLEFYHRWMDHGQDDSQEVPTTLVLPLHDQFLLTTGAVNLRDAPSLDGEKVASVPEGTWLRSLHQVHTDERGVDWYRVRYRGGELWVSSKYAEMQ